MDTELTYLLHRLEFLSSAAAKRGWNDEMRHLFICVEFLLNRVKEQQEA